MNRFLAFLALAVTTSPSAAFTSTKLSAARSTKLYGRTDDELRRRQVKVEPIPDDYVIPKGYVGGFADSNPEYTYPRDGPNLDDIPIMDNMDNIDKLDRQQEVRWPEFSWLTIPGDETSRVYQRFASNVSRLGYSNDGRIYSIICPQQGVKIPNLGTISIEVTVTGVRGWCKEDEKTFYADMGVVGQVWFAGKEDPPLILKVLKKIVGSDGFPDSKENAIVVDTHNRFEPWNKVFQVANGTTTEYPIPQYAQHWDDNAYGVGHIYVEIGKARTTGSKKMNAFHTMVITLFNKVVGNKLKEGNVLSWNLWMAPPDTVDKEEWAGHAHKWRRSIDIKHEYPDGENVHDYVTYYDGKIYGPPEAIAHDIDKQIDLFLDKWKVDAIDKLRDHEENMIQTIKDHVLFHRNRKN